MTDDQKKNYEEAARAYVDNLGDGPPDHRDLRSCFLAGATHAEDINEAFIQKLRELIEEKDEQMLLQVGLHQQAEKEAYNRAIEDVIRNLRFKQVPRYSNTFDDDQKLLSELEKLKI